MRINTPIIPRNKLVRNIVSSGDIVGCSRDGDLYQEITEYIKDKFGIKNIYDLVNPFIVRSSLITAGSRTKGAVHYIATSESGFEWEDEYTPELAKNIKNQIIEGISDLDYNHEEQEDIKTSSETILFDDFGYIEYFEHMDLSVYHKIKFTSQKSAMITFYKTIELIFSDLFLGKDLGDISEDKLAICLAHLIVVDLVDQRICDTIEYSYEISIELYKSLSNSSISSYLVNLYHICDVDEYVDEFKYTVACIITMAYLFIRNGFAKISVEDK